MNETGIVDKESLRYLLAGSPCDEVVQNFVLLCAHTLDFSPDDLYFEMTKGDALRIMVEMRVPRRQIELVLRMFGWMG